MAARPWTPARALAARRAAVYAWEGVAEAGGSLAERQHAWAGVEHALSREAEMNAAAAPEAGAEDPEAEP